jgi:hypothetical protein
MFEVIGVSGDLSGYREGTDEWREEFRGIEEGVRVEASGVKGSELTIEGEIKARAVEVSCEDQITVEEIDGEFSIETGAWGEPGESGVKISSGEVSGTVEFNTTEER